MVMPDKLLFGLAVMSISHAFSQKPSMELGKAEAQILSVEPAEKASVRAAYNQSSAGYKDTLHLCGQERPILLWNVFDDFDAGHALELAVAKWELKSIPLPVVRIRKLCPFVLIAPRFDLISGDTHPRVIFQQL